MVRLLLRMMLLLRGDLGLRVQGQRGRCVGGGGSGEGGGRRGGGGGGRVLLDPGRDRDRLGTMDEARVKLRHRARLGRGRRRGCKCERRGFRGSNRSRDRGNTLCICRGGGSCLAQLLSERLHFVPHPQRGLLRRMLMVLREDRRGAQRRPRDRRAVFGTGREEGQRGSGTHRHHTRFRGAQRFLVLLVVPRRK